METPQFALRPSSAGMWVRCAGHASMAARYPELPGDNEAREEGTAAHWVAYEIGNNREVPEGSIAPNGVEVTAEILDGVAEYLGVLRSWQLPVYMESQVAIPSIHQRCGGTVDAWAWDAAQRILYVADLKFGRMPVDAFENWQLLAYVRGVLDYLQSIHGQFTEHFTVVMMIVQPRDYGHGSLKIWRTASDKLIPHMSTLRRAANEAVRFIETGTGQYTAGPHCYYCSGAAHCETLQRASLQVMDYAGNHGSLELTPKQIDAELYHLDRAMKLLKARAEALEIQVTHLAGKGQIFEHFAMSAGNPKLAWKPGEEENARALAKLLGSDIAKPLALMTPKQVRDAGKLNPELLKGFTQEIPGKVKLRRIAANHADKLFS